MKVKFTKLAALLLAGAALFATGCTDYEVDIQNVDKKVDNLTADVNGKISSLEQQIAGINATIATLETIANHDKDIAAVRNEMATLKTTLENDYNGKINDAVATLNAAIDKKLDKTTFEEAKQQITEALATANQKIQALELQDQAFKDQIADLTTQVNNRLNALEGLLAGDWNEKTVKETIDALDQKVTDLAATAATQIGLLDQRLTAAEIAIDKINDETIPALKQRISDLEKAKTDMEKEIADLKTGKLDVATFNEYKEATAKTIAAMQAAIGDLTKLEGVAKDKASLVEAINAVIAKFDDYVLVTEFEEFKKIAATKEELAAVEAGLNAKIAELKKLIGEFPEGMTVREYIDKEIKKVQDQIDDLVEKCKELEKRVAKLEDTVNNVIMPEIKFAIGYEGYYTYDNGLQGYIEDWAIDAYLAACDYTDAYIEALCEVLDEIFNDIYDILAALAHRVQSIVYVPDYDDLKITTNVSGIVTVNYDTENGEPEEVAELLDQPFKVTYKITPTRYAPAVAASGDLYFDIKKVNTRADDDDDAADEPYLEIVDVISVDDFTGEVTLLVQAYNVASNAYVANALRPQYDVELRAGGIPGVLDGHHVWGTDHVDRGFVGYGEDYTWSIPIWNYEELKAYEARCNFAAALQLYTPDIITDTLDQDPDDDDLDWFFENEISSNYNVLYPNLDIYEIPSDPWKGLDEDEDEDGNKDVREFTYDEQHQKLPYNAIRQSPTDSTNFRVILEDAVAVVIIDEKAYGLFPETVEGGFHKIITEEGADPILIPEVKISDTAEIEYIKNGDYLDEENYKINGEVGAEEGDTYVDVEMNGEKPASDRKYEIGNLVQGTYTFTSAFGSFPAVGDVLIVKEQGAVRVDAEAYWTWDWNRDLKLEDEQGNVLNLGDALVDHNIFYNVGQLKNYQRIEWPVAVNAEDAAKLAEELDVDLEDFAGLDPSSDLPEVTPLVIEVADRLDANGAEIAEADLEFEKIFPAEETTTEPATGADTAEEAPAFTIDGVAIKDGKLYANFKNFEWDKVYKVTATYELEVATITVTGYFKTIDRNREPVTVDMYTYTFGINEQDEETGFGWTGSYYKWRGEDMTDRIFKAFDEEGVINLLKDESYDFEYDDDIEDFYLAELKNKIKHGNGEGEDGVPPDVYDYLKVAASKLEPYTADTFTAAKLKEVNSGKQDPNDPYTFLGDTLYRYFTTYIGEVVQVPFQFNYRVPAYDFLHQENFTFNDGNWYSLASPKYWYNKKSLAHYDVEYMNIPALAFNIIDENNRFLFYNNGEPLDADDPDYFYDENLVVNFWYTDPELDETEIEPQSQDEENNIMLYKDLWFTGAEYADYAGVATAPVYQHTVFYYRSTREAIPMFGDLAVLCDGVEFPIPTSFEEGNGGKYLAGQDYSDFELRAWKPFYVPEYSQTLTVNLDEHDDYLVNILEGLQFFDAREVAASTPVTGEEFAGEGVYAFDDFNYGTKCYFRPMLGFNEEGGRVIYVTNSEEPNTWWSWIQGNTDAEGNAWKWDDEEATYVIDPDAHANGFWGEGGQSVTSWEAYGLKMNSFKFDARSGVPASLRQMIEVMVPSEEEIAEMENQFAEPYLVKVDYNSQVQFSGVAKVSFSFDFQTPWQKFEKPFTVTVEIKGLDQQ